MKTTLFILAAFMSISWTTPEVETPEDKTGIEFFKGTWAEVLAESEKTGKPIFVDAYAVWCGPCKSMSNYVFTNANVGEFYNENFINYKFDMERGEGPSFASKYQIRAYPTFLFINAKGKVIYRTMGFKKSEPFIEEGKMALSKS